MAKDNGFKLFFTFDFADKFYKIFIESNYYVISSKKMMASIIKKN